MFHGNNSSFTPHDKTISDNHFRAIYVKNWIRPRKISDDSSNSSGYGSEILSVHCVTTSGSSDSFSSKSQDLALKYRVCNFGNTLQVVWTSSGAILSARERKYFFNNEAFSPSESIAMSGDNKNQNSPPLSSISNIDHKMAFFRKCLRSSLLPEMENHPEKMRLINGKFNNVYPQSMMECSGASPVASLLTSCSEMSEGHSRYGFATGETWRVCHFCLKNGEPEILYTTHELKGPDGLITCPVLRRYVCELCGATGSFSHTKRYCPLYLPSSD